MEQLNSWVAAAKRGELDAYGRVVQATQAMACGVAMSVLRDPAIAQDAVQEGYLRAFRRLADLQEPAAFPGWLRRIVITVALNMRRAKRQTWLCLDDLPDVPVLDEAETSWSERQRLRLAGALLTLNPEERRLCDRRYHGRWSTARLAKDAGVDDAAMRKRLQRLRDKLRKEMEMAEQRDLDPEHIRPDLPARVVELLARPRLTELPENPVGRVLDLLRSVFDGFTDVALPEIVNLAAAEQVARDAIYVETAELHRLDDARILRYDLTLPLLLTVRFEGRPLRIWAAGKAYRVCRVDATHLEAFHQAEVFWLDERDRLDPWQMTALVLKSMDRVLPGHAVKLVPTEYPMCSQAWDIEVEHEGHWSEVLACGIFNEAIVSHVGADPRRQIAVGVGYGLERLAMIRYGIDDIRKVDVAHVA